MVGMTKAEELRRTNDSKDMVGNARRVYLMINHWVINLTQDTHHGEATGCPLPSAELIMRSSRQVVIEHEQAIVAYLESQRNLPSLHCQRPFQYRILRAGMSFAGRECQKVEMHRMSPIPGGPVSSCVSEADLQSSERESSPNFCKHQQIRAGIHSELCNLKVKSLFGTQSLRSFTLRRLFYLLRCTRIGPNCLL